jgi:spermidine/putrescine transport system permease protein
MPLVFPEIVFGIMILVWFLILRLTLGHISILLAHVTFSVSYALLAVRARLNNFDEALLEAARDLGATTTQAFWRVTVPLLLPGIISAFFMSFAMSFDDFLITFFVSGVGTDTLPVKLYSMIKFGIKPAAYALSAAVLVLTVVIMIFAVRLSQWTSDAK